MSKPPYTITGKAAEYLVMIDEIAARLEYGAHYKRDIRLRRENRARTLHSSLAVKGSALTLAEVSAVIEGNKQSEAQKVRNACAAYDQIITFNPYLVADFLKAHKLMTRGLVKETGQFRSSGAGVFDGDVAVHIGAKPQLVPKLIRELFAWAQSSDLHPALKSAVLHYEIEIIHPFSDGNGRMGRLWQTLLLAKWNAVFAWIPMESVFYQNRPQYYKAIEDARKVSDPGVFIEFTLAALYKIITEQAKRQAELTDTRLAVLKSLENKPLSRQEIFAAIGMSGDARSFKRHIAALLAAGTIELTVPDKPAGSLRKYRLPDSGKVICS